MKLILILGLFAILFSSTTLLANAPIIVLGSVTVLDGNGNGKIDPNECNHLTIELGNNGDQDATGISAVLSTATPEVIITQPNSTYPDIPPGMFVQNATPFEISTTSNFGCGMNVFLTLTVTSSAGTNTFDFELATGNDYTVTTSIASIVPGTTDIGVHCDDCSAPVTLPFPYFFYRQQMLSANVVSNGDLQFNSNDTEFDNQCLPASIFNNAILPHWDDLNTGNSGEGVFTSISGSAPNRIFNIEWRTELVNQVGNANFEVRLYEDRQRVDLIYGTVDFSGLGATVGIQKGTGSAFVEYSCNDPILFNTLQITLNHNICTQGNGSCVSCPTITLSPPALPDGIVGAAYNQTITANGGTPPYTFSVTTGTLPDGLTLDNSTGVISGTPTTEGTFNFTIRATDSLNCFGEQPYAIMINPAGSVLFFDDFEDGVLDANWTYVKSNTFWSESGGNLMGTNIKKTSAVASPVFVGCANCYAEASMRTAGGTGNRVWLLHHYIDKDNTIELLMKEETDRWVIKQRIGKKVVAKTKAQLTIDPNVFYTAHIQFDGTQYIVSVDGTQVMTLLPAGSVAGGTVGFKVKGTTGSFGYIQVN